MDDAPHSLDPEAEAVTEDSAEEISPIEPAAEPEPEADESSFDAPVTDVEETLVTEREPEPEAEEPSAGEPGDEGEAEPMADEEPVAEEEPDTAEAQPDEATGEEPTAPELVLEPESEPAEPAEDLSLDDMVAEIAQSQGGEAALAGEGSEAAEGEGAETGATEGEGAAAEGAEGEAAAEAVPAPAEEGGEEGREVPALVRQRMQTRIPFWVYGGVWVVFVGVMTYLIWPSSTSRFTGSELYAIFVLGGGALTVIGLLVGLFTWLAGRSGTSQGERQGLTMAVLLRCAGWMTVGVVLWWIALIVLDLHRIGVIR